MELNLKTLNKEKPVYMIGIGGISMSALAVILKQNGFQVLGSDFKESDITNMLEEKGISVSIGHKKENVGDVSCVVYTAAISADNPELMHAKTLGVPVVERAVLLGEIMKEYKNAIAVSGTHGKTTSTSMLSQILLEAGLDPTILVGGILPSIGSNLRAGNSDVLVTEACEYCGSFLKFFPKISIILNVEEDHLDYFKDIDDIIRCFHDFALITPDDGAIIVNYDDKNAMAAVEATGKHIITFSTESKSADFYAENLSFKDDGCAEFDIMKKGVCFMHASLSVPGMHNVKNALAVTAAADLLGVVPEDIQKGFDGFFGTKRRFEKKGMTGGVTVMDDYAHHPTEIMATLSTAQKMKAGGKVFCVFQPHTYTRSFKLRKEFSTAFSDCDKVILVDIYAAREKDTGLIHAKDLAEDISSHSQNAVYAESFEDAKNLLKEWAQPGDTIFTIGAGDVYKIGEAFLNS